MKAETNALISSLIPDSLPSIDTRIGRASTNGNDALYHRLLLMFADGQFDAVERFRDARAQGDVVTAMRVAHNLRTSASTLGMTALGDLALDLELICRDGVIETDQVSALLGELDRALAPVLVSLRGLRSSTPATPASTPAPALVPRPDSARENPRPPALSDGSRSD